MDVIDQIKNTASIVDVASQYTTLRRRGKKHLGLCPFHSEKTPSFTVDEDKQLFHCFGCNIGGDLFTLVMEKENLSFPEALRFLAEKYNIVLPEKRKFSPQLAKLEEKLTKISEDSLAFFRKNLFNTKEGENAQEYLRKREISEELIQKLKIGYALNSWDALLSFFQRKDISPSLLEKAGLVLRRAKKEGHYDRFRGRIIFPIFTPTGKVVAFGGRTIIDQDPKYLNSPDTPIYTKGKLLYGWNFTKDAVREQREIILVEGYTDLLALLQSGIPNVAASLGTSLTSEQVMQASRFESRVIVSYDADAAGIKASLRAISLCFEQGVEISVLTLPKGYDPDSFIRKYGPKDFLKKLQESKSGFNFLVDTYVREKKKGSPEQKNRVAKYIVNEIFKIPNSIIQSEYLKKLSEELNLKEDVLRFMIKTKTKEEDNKEVQTVFLIAEKRLLQILFHDSNIVPTVIKAMKKEDFTGLQSESIFLIMLDFINNRVDFNILNIREKIDKSLFSSLAKILQEEEQEPSVEEAMECVRALRQFSLENESLGLKHEISRLEKANEIKKALLIMKKLQDVKMQLLRLQNQEL
ncbi:MAG: DNA primase [Candidatus Aminicenantes bacterium]|nr:DNA primase [Candidatus Aminicenantes bacterium]